jgi:hypothetical protein
MGSGTAFAVLFTIMLISNVVIVFIDPTTDPLALLTVINFTANLALTVLLIGVLSASVLGSGLSDQYIRLLIGVVFMIMTIFAIPITPFTFGLNLGGRLMGLAGDPFGIWNAFITAYVLVTLIIGVVFLAGGE